jgi:hypothetical protein
MKLLIRKGTTSKRLTIFVQDATQSDQRGLSGLLFNSAGLAWYFRREDAGNAGGTAVTLATATRGTWASGGFIELDATNMKGHYEIGVPDTVLALGADWAIMTLAGAANMVPVQLELQLVNFDPADGVRLGLTGLPAALVGGRIDASLGAIQDAVYPTFTVQADAGNSATQIKTNRTETDSDYWRRALVILTSGALIHQLSKVSAYNGSTKVLTLQDALTGTPAAGVTGILLTR